MMIRTKITLSHALLALTVTLVSVVILMILRVGEVNQRELHSSYSQIQAIKLVAASANDYAEQIAEIFILGTDTSEAETARDELLAALSAKENSIDEELGYLTDEESRANEREELDRINEMRTLIFELDAQREYVVDLILSDRLDQAEIVYREQIENRLDSVLGALIDTATEVEREEVNEAIRHSIVLNNRLELLAFAFVGVMATLAFANALMLHNSLSQPISSLMAGVDAVGRGDLAHTVELNREDELGKLASRFNVMTEQIQDQRERLLDRKRDLERVVEERTAELRERGEELEEAVARLSEVDASRARFLADISHELRTPLTIVRGQAEVTLRAPDNDPARLRQALGLVVRKSEEMGRLVDDILFLARSEAGAIALDREPVDLQEVVAEVLFDCRRLPRSERVSIRAQQPPEPVRVQGDKSRLRQAILIPIDNAIRVAPPGTTVDIELIAEETAAVIVVRDEGPGFTPEDAERAFVRFFRGPASRGRAGRGSGLGLSIARWIVDWHGGTIHIESEQNHGACVRIELPLLGETTT